MNEEELKKIVNSLRHEISTRNKGLKKLYEKLTIQKRDAEDVKGKRDDCNREFRGLLDGMKEFKNQRNEMNKKIKGLKLEHKTWVEKIKKFRTEIKDLKSERDRLNKRVRGTEKTLHEKLDAILKELLEKDVGTEKEKKLFTVFFNLKEKWVIARDADTIHTSIVEKYEGIKKLESKVDEISKKIESISKGADDCHKKVLSSSKEMDKIRKLSDDYHEDLKRRYKETKPVFDQISSTKENIRRLEEKLTPYNKELEKIRATREEQKKSKTAKEVKAKLLGQKRVTLEDFRVMLEREGLSGEA